MANYLEGLNEKQKDAVLSTEGPLLILAGAGAGKTKTLTHRILHLVQEGVAPYQILAITFTNKAAKEMRERVGKLLSDDLSFNRPISNFERPFVSTFHSLGVHIIKENCRLLDIPRHFSIFDRGDSLSAIKQAVKNLDLDPKMFEPSRFLAVISKEKGKGRDVSELRTGEYNRDFFGRVLKDVWEKYEATLKNERALDFDDLLLKTLQLLQNNKEVRERYQKIWKYIHIDEYQDTNSVQYDIAKLLAGGHNNICVVGDIDQSIYSWRGADFKNIMRFEDDFQNVKVVVLEQNYRSTKTILKAANTIIAKNTLRKEKNLFTENIDGEKISLYGSFDEEDEAYYVARTAKNLIANGTPPKEVAALYRANFQSRILEEAMLHEGVPYQVLGVRFFERKEIKDVLSYLKAALDPASLSDMKRIINVPPRGIGKVTIAKIFSGNGEELPGTVQQKVKDFHAILTRIKEKIEKGKVSEAVFTAIVESGLKKHYEEGSEEDLERLENMGELVTLSKKYDFLPNPQGIEELLTDAALASDQDDMKEEYDAVKLMTVHASKGLEFEYVFITGLEDDLFPHRKPDGGRKELEEQEEERRLFYVALTRAKKKLFLSYAAVRTIFGSRQVSIPSEFLSDIDQELLEDARKDGGDSEPRGKIIYLE
jgi:DNA helicase-2/ATP-dependent DNA helicase PcrA